jgi:hypothetical protein
MGENTLQGGPKMLSHCTILQWCPCLNFNHGNIGAYFFQNSCNMVDYNTKIKSQKIIICSTYIV